MKFRKRTLEAAVLPEKPKDRQFDPSTWARQPRLLARNRADAAVLLWIVAVILGDVAWGVAVVALGAPVPSWDLIGAMAGGQVVLIVLAWVWTFARSLAEMTFDAQRATWVREQQMGLDLDGDGEIGEPAPVGHVMRINGRESAVLPNLERPARPRPLAGFPAKPEPITPDDVLYILGRAAGQREDGKALVGLGFRQWEGHSLPSGAKPGRDEWSAIQDGLLTWEFATARRVRGRRLVDLRSDVRVDDMMRAVRLSVRESRAKEAK